MSEVTIIYKTKVTVDLGLKKIEEYLKSKGWTDNGPYGQFGRFYLNKEASKEVIVPTTDKIGDFNTRMNELVQEVADAEERSVPNLLEHLK